MPPFTDDDDDDDPRTPTASSPAAAAAAAFANPDSPGAAHNSSSDESTSSDVVLVDHPGHDSRLLLHGDPDSGILVNIDGSMQDNSDSSAREETFEDASDQLAIATTRSISLGESVALVDLTDTMTNRSTIDELDHLHARLNETASQCRKYKEEREVFGREIAGLRRELHSTIGKQSLLAENNDGLLEQLRRLEQGASDEDTLSSPTPLHSMLGDCSKIVFSLKSILDEQVRSRAVIPDLRALLDSKDREIGGLNDKLSESDVSSGVVTSYLGSLGEVWSESTDERISKLEEENLRMAEQLGLLRQGLDMANADTTKARKELEQTEGRLAATREKLSIAVTKGKSLVQHRDTLKQSLAERTTELESCRQELQHTSEALHSTKASAESLESELERRSLELKEKSDALASVEASAEEWQWLLSEKNSELERCLLELDQKTDALDITETSAEELKKSLAEKTSELDKCLLELQQMSKDFDTAKTNSDRLSEVQHLVQSLQELLLQHDKFLQEIEETMCQYDLPPELLSMDVINQVKWFINQKHITDDIFLDNCKIRDALSIIDLPEDISSVNLDSQIHWLGKSLAQVKTDFIKLQDEIASAHVGVALHETELSEAHLEIERLTASLYEERRIKDYFRGELDVLRCKYEEMVEKLIKISSQKDELMTALVEVSESISDKQPSADPDMMVEKCIGNIREMIRTQHTEGEHFDRMQSFLYVEDMELKLLESMLDEVMVDRSEMESISTRLGSASEEIVGLRKERDSLQRELERVEERSSQIKDRLSLAVRKGKGLVQERDGYKHSLDEKIAQIEMLNEVQQHQNSAIAEYTEQINKMSAYSEHIQKLESDVVNLKDERDEIELSLQEKNNTLQMLLDSVESVVLPTNKHFKEPIEKVNWIAEHISKSEVAKTHVEQELEKIKEEATLQSCRLTDAFTTINLLENQLAKAEKEISVIAEKKKDVELGRTSIEHELEKMKEEHYMQTSKLADAYTTIKSLEDALSNADTQILFMNRERTEAESRNKLEVNTLNDKLTECMEELAKTHGSLESKSDELNNHTRQLYVLMNDQNLLSLMTEEFTGKIKGLRNMGLLIQNMQEQLAAKGLQIPVLEQYPEFAKLFSISHSKDLIEDRVVRSHSVSRDPDDVPSSIKLVEGFRAQATVLGDTFKEFSSYLNDHIAVIMQALQVARDQFIQILEVNQSLTLNLNNFEAQNEAQELKIASLQKEFTTLLSACTDATQELQIEFHDLLDIDSSSEQDNISFNLESTSKDAVVGVLEQWDAVESPKAAKTLLLTARKVRSHFEQLANLRSVWLTSTDDLKSKLKQAELTAATAISDGHINQERVSKLQVNLEALQNVCSEMKAKIEDYQAKEDMLRNKKAELFSLEQDLTAKNRESGDGLLSQEQMETLIDKINRIDIPSNVLETQSQKVLFSSSFDKLFYILDDFTELQHRMDSLSNEKEDMQLSLESHVREIEHLREAAETKSDDYQDLKSKRIELVELTDGLEKVIQRLGGNYLFEDQKPVTAKGLLQVLERLTSASSMEVENLKSRMQEITVKLQEKEKVAAQLSTKVTFLEDSIHARSEPDTVKERTVFEPTTSMSGSEISEIEDVGPLGKSSISPVSAAAHVRSMRKGSTDHLVLNIGPESDRLISARETDDKGHFFKSLNASGVIPKQGKLIADRVDGIWVSGGRILMSRPGARLGLIAYWLFLHIWILGTIL